MQRLLNLSIGVVVLGACAPGLPPAPSIAPVAVPIHDSLTSVTAAAPSGEPDAELLDELASSSAASDVEPLEAQDVTWDFDVSTYATHPRVQYYLSYFKRMPADRMAVMLERGARYEPMIRARFEAEGLPGDLFYLALIESGYSTEAVSRAYAVGIWQFMRRTGRGYGLRVDTWVDERRDPVKATDAAARHLRDLRDRFGSLYLAAAAYNAGAGKVSRSLGKLEPIEEAEDESDEDVSSAAAGNAAFFRLAESNLLANETRDYVPKLIAAAIIAKQPARYGIPTSAVERYAYDSLVVTDATGLDVVARLAGVDLSEIRDLNPQYLRLATPPRTSSVIRLPAGTGPAVAETYAELAPSERVRYLTHVVRKRERLSTIAANHRIPLADLRAANPKYGPNPRPGARLVVPAVAIPSALAVRAASDRRPHHSASSRTHRVRRGETLSGIARRYRVTVTALRRANSIRNEHAVMAGTRLRIPG
ncbi:MAG TPA: transglycosylase SLT domain-containing protein [Gemmatimonadales bacterium]|nr:transglycosylase SLT domain-containing protein [Gemmatimonadales bacterium]